MIITLTAQVILDFQTFLQQAVLLVAISLGSLQTNTEHSQQLLVVLHQPILATDVGLITELLLTLIVAVARATVCFAVRSAGLLTMRRRMRAGPSVLLFHVNLFKGDWGISPPERVLTELF